MRDAKEWIEFVFGVLLFGGALVLGIWLRRQELDSAARGHIRAGDEAMPRDRE